MSSRQVRLATSASPASARLRSTSNVPRRISPKRSSSHPPTTLNAPSLLERWAQAVHQQGRLQEARQALEEALALDREPGRPCRGRPRPDPPLARALPARRPTKRRDDRRGSRAARDATAGPGARRRPHLPGRGPRAHWPLPGGGRGGRAGTRARRGARPARAGIRASLARPRPLPPGRSGRARGRASGAPARARAGPGPRNRRHPRQPRRRRGVLRGATGRTRRLDAKASPSASGAASTEFALNMRAASLDAPRRARADTSRRSPRSGRSPTACQAAGDMAFTSAARGCSCGCSPNAATPDHAPDPDELVAAARDIGLPISDRARVRGRRPASARPAPTRAGAGAPARARPARPPRSVDLLGTSRLAFVAARRARPRRRPLAQRLATGIEPVTPLDEHVLAAGRAQLAEAAGEHADAARLYARGGRALARSSGTCPSAPTPCSARAAAWLRSAGPERRAATARGAGALRIDGLRSRGQARRDRARCG